MRNADGIESARYSAMFTSFSLTRNADGIDSARLWSILPVSNNIAELPGLVLGWINLKPPSGLAANVGNAAV